MPDQPEKSPQNSWKSKLKPVIETVEMIVMALVLYFLIDSVVARVRVQKVSMEPTLVPRAVARARRRQGAARSRTHATRHSYGPALS